MSDEANNSDNFSQDNDDRHRDSSRHSEERLRDDRDDRSPLRSPRHHDRRSPLSRSRSRSPRRSRSPSRGDEENLNPGNNLFVTGLSMRTGDRELEDIFSKYGKVLKAQIMYDPHTRDSRGFGFVTMETLDEAEAAREGINGSEINGRILTVEKARRARARTPTPGRYYGPPKRREPRKVDRFDPRYEYSRSYDRYERPPRGYGRDPYYDRAYDRPYYDRGYERGYDRAYDRTYDRAYDRDRRPPPPARYEPYPRPRSPY
ncbi:RNA-binding domain-containing protein [Rhizophagus irregularis]|jgi:transformer-2 protein|uniref:RNA-binding domain-containing protein n=3 Tax=Rhizophagus irregularis TaxID=588596 RepID=A0A2I1DR50_9GLOM|nr:Pub1p [Rhizophagus irregularis DAOM 197198w]PKC17893.1 RNA-binding domain-containing protein [Rhizophagus irregularis]GBC26091.1 RNA-binding domain-containing protein [Rhizophagus irregularis DAOM 181602=DAOM 197198]PKC74098.1 RNA-binding domain-containing protein [Rhizophagus irregularis]PKY12353.1 RNA-binding domain-containing protein [Rhizophagus irregularis]